MNGGFIHNDTKNLERTFESIIKYEIQKSGKLFSHLDKYAFFNT